MILVGQDGIYAPPVRRLRLLGIPTWLLVPGRSAATSLYRASSAVSYIGPPSQLVSARGWPLDGVCSPATGGDCRSGHLLKARKAGHRTTPYAARQPDGTDPDREVRCYTPRYP